MKRQYTTSAKGTLLNLDTLDKYYKIQYKKRQKAAKEFAEKFLKSIR